jgi:glycosyltransferase involved in cell wall biosynthesis
MKLRNIIIFGKIPPPIGGVTMSVKNLINSLEKYSISSSILSFSTFFNRYDIAHIHYSRLWKRAIGVSLGRLIAKRVIFTVHGKYLDTDNIFNKWSIYVSHGVILLNNQIYEKIQHRADSSKFTIMPSIFKEGIDTTLNNEHYVDRIPDKKYLLIYAYDRTYKDGEEVYGIEFIVNNINRIDDKYIIVILDLSGKYQDLIESVGERALHIKRSVNFLSLLNQIDIYLRPTCMDGSSVAVQEALFMNKPVLASDIIDRPNQVITYKYKDIDDFVSNLNNMPKEIESIEITSVCKYIRFCECILTEYK